MSNHVVHFHCNITSKTIEGLRNLLYDIVYSKRAERYFIEFSSSGGDVTAGFQAYEIIRQLPAKASIVATNIVESMAAIMLLAGEERIALPNAKFKLHPLTLTFHTEMPFRYAQIEEELLGLGFDIKRYANVFKERTNFVECPFDIDTCLGGASAVFDANTAALCGLVHRVSTRIADVYDGSAVHHWVNA